MQKIKVLIALTVLFFAGPARAIDSRYADKYSDIKKTALEFEARIYKTCNASIRVDLNDFMFFSDELEAYNSTGLEHAQHLINVIEDACKKRDENKIKFKQVGAVIIKRGSLFERKMLLDKNRNIIYLAEYDGKDRDSNIEKLQRVDFERVLNIDFKPGPIKPTAEEIKKIDEAKKREDRLARQQLKVKEAGDWFTAEIKKLTANPTPDLSERADALKKQYEEKLDAALKGN